MADISTGNELHSKTLTTATYDGRSIEIVKDFLQGYTDDYYFFQYDSDTYVLLYDFQDSYVISPAGITVSGGCSIYEIDLSSGSVALGRSDIYNITGSLVGDDTQVFTNAAATRAGSVIYQTYTSYYSNDISISRNYKLCYSSASDYPKLIEGSERYAFAEIFLLVIFFISVSLDLVFRRISR